MISGVTFRSGLQANTPAKDLYGAPQKFQRSTPYVEDAPKKKSGVGKKIALGVVTVAAIATALALCAKKGVFDPKALGSDAGKFAQAMETAKKGLKTAGDYIADNATKLTTKVKDLFAKKAAPTA